MGYSHEWVMHPEDCAYPPAMEKLPPAKLLDLVREYYRYEVECEAIRQTHYNNLDEILEGYR